MIAQWLREQPSAQPVLLLELQQGLGIALVETWLGLLLGQEMIVLTQQGDFYASSTIQVELNWG